MGFIIHSNYDKTVMILYELTCSRTGSPLKKEETKKIKMFASVDSAPDTQGFSHSAVDIPPCSVTGF